MDEAAEHLRTALDQVAFDQLSDTRAQVLRECALQLGVCKSARQEYVLLAFHALSPEPHASPLPLAH
jgi:hypothetical protein